jgi:hypothetical protein
MIEILLRTREDTYVSQRLQTTAKGYLGNVGIPETARRRGLGGGAARLHRLIKVVAADAPFLAQLVGGQLAPQDPIADRLLLELQARSDLFRP